MWKKNFLANVWKIFISKFRFKIQVYPFSKTILKLGKNISKKLASSLSSQLKQLLENIFILAYLAKFLQIHIFLIFGSYFLHLNLFI